MQDRPLHPVTIVCVCLLGVALLAFLWRRRIRDARRKLGIGRIPDL